MQKLFFRGLGHSVHIVWLDHPACGGEAAMMIARLWRWRHRQSHARRRRRDTKMLWPQLLQTYGDQDAARNEFCLHISLDPAWRDLNRDKRDHIIDGLH